ncbi:MAG: CDP-alcohol phosphatidyltransferase family protein [Candidatus Anstonellales archaeon]
MRNKKNGKEEKIDADKIENIRSLLSKPFMSFHPDHLTYSSLIFAFFGSLFFYYSQYLISIFLICISFLLDAVDGYVARAKNITTSWGAFIDGIADRIVEFMFIFTLMLKFPYATNILVIFLSFGTFLHSFAKAYASHRNVLSVKEAAKIESIMPRKIRVFAILLIAISLIFDFYWPYITWFFAFLSIIAFIQLLFIIKLKQNKENKKTQEKIN